jgi:glucose-1-phosphate thymidylyltransferase
MLAGIRDFVIITNPKEKQMFEQLFVDSYVSMGIRIRFLVQDEPKGIADAFRIVHNVLGPEIDPYDRYALILGDNIFHGSSLTGTLQKAIELDDAVVFATKVHDPERFGVVEVDKKNKAISIEEKPTAPKSNLAVTGLYFYPKDVIEKVYNLRPSSRGELEITDLNNIYLSEQRLSVNKLLRGTVWFDTGTPDSMMEASIFIQTLQKQQNIAIGSPHEVAYTSGWIQQFELEMTANLCSKTFYGKYLSTLTEN